MGKFKWSWKYIDPFYPYDLLINFLKKKSLSNKFSDFIIFVVYALILAYLLLKILALILGGQQAMQIIVSGSMQPFLNIGDIVVLTSPANINTNYVTIDRNISGVPLNKFIKPDYIIKNGYPYIKDLNIDGQIVKLDTNGDIVVYYSGLEKKEIIHRVVVGIKANDGVFYLTKGDNYKTNFVLDADCAARFKTPSGIISVQCLYPYALAKKDVLSKYLFTIPYLGWIKLGPAYLFGWRANS